jgi:KaiC/GvpD/RAD55 family RecA-like ATPase
MSNNDSRITSALAYARKGWPVFPVGDNKLPAVKAWERKATTDETQIRQWFDTVAMDGCNFGFCPGRAGIMVVDLDTGKKDKDGNAVSGKESLAAFLRERGEALPETYTVRTPSGGIHLYYSAAGVKSKNGFLPAVDVKSCGGYVVAPGSINANGGKYEVIRDVEVAQMPQWFLDLYGRQAKAATKAEKMPLSLNAKLTPDTAEKIEAGINICAGWPVIDEGERNDQLFQLMRELCKAGISASKAKELYRDHGLESIGLDPDSHEVAATIASAYKDMTEFGAESEEARRLAVMLFDVLPEDKPAEAEPDDFGVDWTELEAREVPERRWFIEDWLSADEGYTVLFSGRGGTGKSGLMLDLMRSLATGEPWCGMEVKRGGKCMYVSCEDSEEEIARRIQRRKSGVPKGSISIVSRLGKDNVLCTAGKDGRLKVEKFYHELKKAARAFFGAAGGVLILDTLSDVFAGDESNRAHVSQFIKYLMNRLGQYLGVTIVLLAHPAKGGSKDMQGYSGSTAWEGGFRCRWELNYQDPAKVDGLLNLVLAKSNSARPGQVVTLANSGGLFTVVDTVDVDNSVREAVLEAITIAYEERKPYGRTSRAARPISAARIVDPVTGNWLTGDEIEQVVQELLAEGVAEYRREENGMALKPASDVGCR